MRVADAAIRYTRRGWYVLPIPHQSKNPGTNGWQRLRLSEADLHEHFNGQPQNIGVLLGEPSISPNGPTDMYFSGSPAGQRSGWRFRM